MAMLPMSLPCRRAGGSLTLMPSSSLPKAGPKVEPSRRRHPLLPAPAPLWSFRRRGPCARRKTADRSPQGRTRAAELFFFTERLASPGVYRRNIGWTFGADAPQQKLILLSRAENIRRWSNPTLSYNGVRNNSRRQIKAMGRKPLSSENH